MGGAKDLIASLGRGYCSQEARQPGPEKAPKETAKGFTAAQGSQGQSDEKRSPWPEAPAQVAQRCPVVQGDRRHRRTGGPPRPSFTADGLSSGATDEIW